MATIDLKLKSYDELQFEITGLITDNYLKKLQIQELTYNRNELKEYVKERIEEFKNAGRTRKEIKAHHYYKLLCDIEKILNSSL